MNILILTGKFGMGHWSASQSLRQQLLRAFPGAEVEVLDFVAEAMPNASEAMYKCFNLLVTRGSGLFNLYYKLTQDLPADARPLFETLFLDKLEELVAARRPDAVIATHPLCARMVSRWKGETGSALPLITCVTDLSSHSEWIHKYTDCYLVGSNDIRSRLAAKGVDRDIICVTGIPVRCEFKRPVRRQAGALWPAAGTGQLFQGHGRRRAGHRAPARRRDLYPPPAAGTSGREPPRPPGRPSCGYGGSAARFHRTTAGAGPHAPGRRGNGLERWHAEDLNAAAIKDSP